MKGRMGSVPPLPNSPAFLRTLVWQKVGKVSVLCICDRKVYRIVGFELMLIVSYM